MFRQSVKLAAVFAASVSLTACGGSSCSSEEDVKAKAEELQQKIQALATSGDMNKMMGLVGKMGQFKAKAQTGDYQAACEAMDELMEEL